MRSILLILGTIILLGGGVALYTYLQPASARKQTRPISALSKQRPQLGQTMHGVGEGANPWVKSFDAKTGELKSQMRADQWSPRKDNSVDVTTPQAEFYSGDGRQRIRIDGTDGNVVLPASPQEKTARIDSGTAPAMPTRGKLHNVIVSVFDPVDAPEPMLTAKMNNAAFDTDNFRIATESFTDAKGNNIDAEQVPVVVRGRDYDFDGRGLVIRWNERDRKLQLLQVDHVESLTIKNPDALGRTGLVPTTQTSLRPVFQGARPTEGMLASADPFAPQLILAAAKPPAKSAKAKAAAKKRKPAPVPPPATGPATTRHGARDLSPVVYRATFERDVQILEDGTQVASAPLLYVDLLQESSKPAASQTAAVKATTRSSTHPSTRTARSRTTRRADSTTQNSSDSPEPALKGPITVKCSGKLLVVPLGGTPDPTLVPGKAIMHLVGTGTTLNRNGMNAECGEAIFNSADNSASLLPGGDTHKVTMTMKEKADEQGWKVTTPRVNYVESPTGARTATLIGASTATIPVAGDDPSSREMMNARWADTCTLLMTSVNGATVMDRADLNGNVVVDHPKMNLSSDALRLTFDPNAPTTHRAATSQAASQSATLPSTLATTTPATRKSTTAPIDSVSGSLKEILATGNAHCKIVDEQSPQTIDSQRLKVTLGKSDEGQAYPEVVDADGSVHTSNGKDTLSAGHMTARLAPATKPAATQASIDPTAQPTTHALTKPTTSPFGAASVRLISLRASDNVLLNSEDSTASADELHVDTVDDQPRYTLIGKPNATITSGKGPNGKTTIVGPRIAFDPAHNLAQIIGGGKVDGVDPNDLKKNMKMSWTGEAAIDGNTDLIDIDREVVVRSIDPDGTVNTATAKHLQAKMTTTKPTTKAATEPTPATQVASTAPAKTKSSFGDMQSVSFMKDKQVTAGTLTGDVQIRSELKAADGYRLRGLLLKTEEATFDQIAGRMVIPLKGEMIYEDHRPPGTQEAKQAATQNADDNPTLGSGRGATAFGWEKSLVYDESQHRVEMTGDVQVHHHPEADNGEPFDLKSQVLTATFKPKPTTQLAQATPTTNPSDQLGQLQLITASQQVHVTSPRYTIDADELTFDPNEQIITARGDARHPITFSDNKTGSSDTAIELFWNTKTDQLKVRGMNGKMRQ